MLLTIKGPEKLQMQYITMRGGQSYGNVKLTGCYTYFVKIIHVSIQQCGWPAVWLDKIYSELQ